MRWGGGKQRPPQASLSLCAAGDGVTCDGMMLGEGRFVIRAASRAPGRVSQLTETEGRGSEAGDFGGSVANEHDIVPRLLEGSSRCSRHGPSIDPFAISG